jgi:hypothetical protein
LATNKLTKVVSLSLLLLILIPFTALTPTNALIHIRVNQLGSSIVNDTAASRRTLSSPGPDLGITNWTHNHIENPDFDQWGAETNPTEWSRISNAERYHWFATEPPYHVNEGTYSAGMQARSNTASVAWADWYQYSLAADMKNLTLTFEWYVDTLPNNDYDYFMIYLELTDSHYIYYYLAGGNAISPANDSSQVNYRLSGSLYTWNTFSRNITADYLSAVGFPGSIGIGLSVYRVVFYIQAGATTGQWLRVYLDDVQLENETATFIGGTVRNGNFENPVFNPWYTPVNYDTSYVVRSSTAQSGAYSCNLTVVSTGNMSQAQIYQFPSTRLTSQNPGIFGFWWQLNQQQVATQDYAMISFQFTNFTDYFRLYYILGHGGTWFFTNTSWDYYLRADNFNTTGSWQHFEQNLWQDIATIFVTNDAILEVFSVNIFTINPNAQMELLVDNMHLIARTVTVADFEDQRDPNTPVYGWGNTYSPLLRVTDQGYGGSKGANCSLLPYGTVNPQQDLHQRPLNSTRETYFDIMWRIDTFTIGRIMFYIYFQDSKILWYVLGASDWGTLANSSSDCYFNVTGSGTSGSWIQLHRDLVHDYETAFGSLPNTEMRSFYFYAYTENANLEVLFDNVYIYDDPAPILSNVIQTPSSPSHGETVEIAIDVLEQDVDTAFLIYRLDFGTFYNLAMSHTIGNTYVATIPAQPWNTHVEYYFEVNDTWGMMSILQAGVTYFNSIVNDLINPTIVITSPNEGATVIGTILIEITATDDESGIDRVEFRLDSTLLATDTLAPYSYNLDSTTFLDGYHDITVTAFDNADNQATDSITIEIANQPPPPPGIPGFPFEALILGLAVAMVVILAVHHQRRPSSRS